MEQKEQPQKIEEKPAQSVPARPNEVGALQIDGFVKIFDPNSKEIFVEKRA
jgi:hypothetical protein